MMNYSNPRIMATVSAGDAVTGVDKSNKLLESIVGTSSAYEADE